jgi:hypothetical protein
MFFGMLILLGLLGCVLFYAFRSFDRLVSAEYRLHRESWIEDGKPAGFFWCPAECDVDTSRAVRLRLTLSWLFRTPRWAADSDDLIGMLNRLRAAVVLWNIGILGWIFGFKLLLHR